MSQKQNNEFVQKIESINAQLNALSSMIAEEEDNDKITWGYIKDKFQITKVIAKHVGGQIKELSKTK